jgi:hypothetical protein
MQTEQNYELTNPKIHDLRITVLTSIAYYMDMCVFQIALEFLESNINHLR